MASGENQHNLSPWPPPERLTFAFHTAEVILTGARLARLVELVHAGDLAAVSVLDPRYANAEPAQPWVASVVIHGFDDKKRASD
jgi:hypothetical protein